MIRKIAICFALVLLGACTGTVNVPPANIDMGVIAPIPGRYAAMIESGGWSLDTKPKGFVCGAWSFKTDANQSYEIAMRDVLMRSLETVDFVASPITPADLSARGYNAFVAVHQGNASSSFGIQQNFFSGTATSEVDLEAVMAITDGSGPYYQQTITGRGGGANEIMTCPSIDQAIARAAQQAIGDIAKSSALYIRDGLRERQIRMMKVGGSAS